MQKNNSFIEIHNSDLYNVDGGLLAGGLLGGVFGFAGGMLGYCVTCIVTGSAPTTEGLTKSGYLGALAGGAIGAASPL